jgi:hypothetical protein
MVIEDVLIAPSVADKNYAKHAVSEMEVYEIFKNEEELVWIRKSQKVSGDT